MAAPHPNANYEPPPGGNKQQQQQQPLGEPVMKKRVYIGNLPPETTREELRELGSKYGRVIAVELIRTKDGRLPFGFVTFLSEEDAGYTAYILHDHVYKSFPLEASLSNSKAQPRTKPGSPRPGGNQKAKEQKKKKKGGYSLRTLTPLNPPTQTNQAVQPNMKNYTQTFEYQGLGSPHLNAPFGWTDTPVDVPQAPLGGASNPGQNNQDFNNQPRNKFTNDSQGSNRSNNATSRKMKWVEQYDEEYDPREEKMEQIPVVVQESLPPLNQLPPPQEPKRQNQKVQNRNPNNTGKVGPQKTKLNSNSGGNQTVNASIQYTQGGQTSNVQVNVETPKKITVNFKLNVNQLGEFLNVIQPYVQEDPQ